MDEAGAGHWDATAAWSLAAVATVWAGSAAIVALVAAGLGALLAAAEAPAAVISAARPPVVVALWSAGALLVFVPAVEGVLGRWVLGLRLPDARQRTVLEPAWTEVCRRAGVDPDRYLLRIQRSGGVNASAGGGHLVAVTTAALGIGRRRLEAILAHELGHHLGGHAATGLLLAWCSGPLRIVVGVARAVSRAGRVATGMGGCLWRVALPVVLVLLLVSCVGALVVLIVAVPLVVARVAARRSELRADATAARLGYGAALLALYDERAASEDPGPRGLRAFFRESHPRFEVRARALRRQLGGLGGSTSWSEPVDEPPSVL
jgi:Zn-dependent protease with chaperone function